MKKMIICALVALVAGIMPAMAFELARYNDPATGLTLLVPDNVAQDVDDGTYTFTTPDEEFVLTLVAFRPSEMTDDENFEAIKMLAASAKIDVSTAESIELDNVNMEGGVFFVNLGEGMSAVGVMESKSKDVDVAFYVALVCGEQYIEAVPDILKNIDLR